MGAKDMFIWYSQYHCRWWPVNQRGWGISSHGVDLVILEYSSITSTGVNNTSYIFYEKFYEDWDIVMINACAMFVFLKGKELTKKTKLLASVSMCTCYEADVCEVGTKQHHILMC